MSPQVSWKQLAAQLADENLALAAEKVALEKRIQLALAVLSHRFEQTSDVLAATRALQGLTLRRPDRHGAALVPWFKVDDTLAFHAKAVAAGNAALGLWVRAGSWSMQQLTEGHVPDHMLPALGRKAEADRLVTVGLWQREQDGYRFWQWAERQPSREQVEAERAAAAERQKRARDKARESRRDSRRDEPVTHGGVTPAVTVPPTRPDPTPSSTKREGTRKRATRTPDTFPITDAMAAWGRENAPLIADPHHETARWLDWCRANDKTYADWTAAWRTWMSRAQQDAATGRPALRAVNGRPGPPPGTPVDQEWRFQ